MISISYSTRRLFYSWVMTWEINVACRYISLFFRNADLWKDLEDAEVQITQLQCELRRTEKYLIEWEYLPKLKTADMQLMDINKVDKCKPRAVEYNYGATTSFMGVLKPLNETLPGSSEPVIEHNLNPGHEQMLEIIPLAASAESVLSKSANAEHRYSGIHNNPTPATVVPNTSRGTVTKDIKLHSQAEYTSEEKCKKKRPKTKRRDSLLTYQKRRGLKVTASKLHTLLSTVKLGQMSEGHERHIEETFRKRYDVFSIYSFLPHLTFCQTTEGALVGQIVLLSDKFVRQQWKLSSDNFVFCLTKLLYSKP